MVLYLALLLPQLSKKSSKRRLEDESLPLLQRLWDLLFVNDATTGRSLFVLMMVMMDSKSAPTSQKNYQLEESFFFFFFFFASHTL